MIFDFDIKTNPNRHALYFYLHSCSFKHKNVVVLFCQRYCCINMEIVVKDALTMEHDCIVEQSLVATIKRLQEEATQNRVQIQRLEQEKFELIDPNHTQSVNALLQKLFWQQLKLKIRQGKVPIPKGAYAFDISEVPDVISSCDEFYFLVPVVFENSAVKKIPFWICLLPHHQESNTNSSGYNNFAIQWVRPPAKPRKKKLAPKVVSGD